MVQAFTDWVFEVLQPELMKRIGHAVMASPKVVETARWFRDTLGFICSDDVYAGNKDNIIGSFNRLDRVIAAGFFPDIRAHERSPHPMSS